MKTLTRFAFVTLIMVGAVGGFAQVSRAQSAYTPITKYDPKRDAAEDIRDAAAEAKRTNRRVLLEVGGEWCSWCHHMDDFFVAHSDLTALRDKSFVIVKINFSEENQNKEVLAQYPAIEGYPHLFVLASDGTLVHSQDTSALEEGKSYNLDRFTTFLAYWAWAKEK
jgi:thioredoxin-related protein